MPVSSDRRIRVMISSRCRDKISLNGKKVEYTVLRREIKKFITDLKPFGSTLFECWINEDSPPIEGTEDGWEACLKQVRRADILVVLYNGNPGWARETGATGICHAELQVGLSSGAAKVFAIELPLSQIPKGKDLVFNRFREYFKSQNLFCLRATTGDEVLENIPSVLHEAIVELVNLGGKETRKSRFDTGDALDWSRLGFDKRRLAIEKVAMDALANREGSKSKFDQIFILVSGTELLCVINAVPAALSNAAAREMVGRPFHHDHSLDSYLRGKNIGGPVHIFACHRSVTEGQASDLLGQPDVATVDTAFGVLAFDRSSKVQCLFLRNCRDETTTRHAVQRMFDWLERSGEAKLLSDRALSRARIVHAMAKENPS